MKFVHKKYKQPVIQVGKKEAQFIDHEFETSDKDLIKALESRKDVDKVEEKKKGDK